MSGRPRKQRRTEAESLVLRHLVELGDEQLPCLFASVRQPMSAFCAALTSLRAAGHVTFARRFRDRAGRSFLEPLSPVDEQQLFDSLRAAIDVRDVAGVPDAEVRLTDAGRASSHA